MRTRHWLAGIVSGCIALAGIGTATAQPPLAPSNGYPDQSGLSSLPAPYSTIYGSAQPNYAGMNMPSYPQGATAWPNVSPFAGPPVDSTSYQDGMWYNQIKTGGRQYYGSLEAIFGHTGKPSTTLIGAQNVNPLSADSVAGRTAGLGTSTTTTSTSLTGLTQFNQAPPGTGPIRSIGASGGGTTTGSTGGSIQIFPTQNTGVLSDTLTTGGVRGTWGWFNPDDTGFVVQGFMQAKGTSAWGLDDPSLIIDPNNQNYNPLLHLHAWFGLPLAGADTDGTSLPSTTGATNGYGSINDGAVQPYDMGVNVQFQSRIAGGSSDWYFNPIYDEQNVMVRPLGGVKYVRLQELFSFDGYDSGLGYTVANSSTSGTGGTSTTTTTSGYLTPQTLQANFATPNVLHSHLNSTVMSNMTGPEIGFRVDLGKKNFTMNLQTRAGALADVSQRQLSGFGIGNGFNIINANTVPAMPNNPTQTQFNNNTSSTSLSPMFEQQVNFKTPIFSMIPYINRMEIFERAQLTGGYTFLFLGDVYRPQNTIVWNQYPQTPQFNNVKSNFTNSYFNIGIEWVY